MTARTFGKTTLALVKADITTVPADAIVNAANAALAGGGGVDGAIHRAGGPSIMEECKGFPTVAPGVKCPTGEVRTTGAGDLDARYVLHAVGPIFDMTNPSHSARLLGAAYRSALDEAARLTCRTVVLPSLSTGAYRFPLVMAAPTALRAVVGRFDAHPDAFDRVTFALFSDKDVEVYSKALAALG